MRRSLGYSPSPNSGLGWKDELFFDGVGDAETVTDEDGIFNFQMYKKLNAALVSLVEDYGLVSFLPLSVKDKQTLLRVRAATDRAGGYVYGAGEERSVQAMLACAVGAECEADRTGSVRDKYTPADEDMVMCDTEEPS
ncbi:GPN-loop GTPase 2 [Homalodisca vitripennis]|nr:GPN-loop GTPase 2 [Homalodisca vitripennis]